MWSSTGLKHSFQGYILPSPVIQQCWREVLIDYRFNEKQNWNQGTNYLIYLCKLHDVQSIFPPDIEIHFQIQQVIFHEPLDAISVL